MGNYLPSGLTYYVGGECQQDGVIKRRYGWKCDKLNEIDTDVHFKFAHIDVGTLPYVVDLRNLCPQVYDQGQLGSCTANALAFVYEFDSKLQNRSIFQPSRLFIYYNEREVEGKIDEDGGAEIRDGIKVINSKGVCAEVATEDIRVEKTWPYDISKYQQRPSQECYDFAIGHRSLRYERVVQTENALRVALSRHFPIVFGFSVYSSFESDEVAKTGIVPMPDISKETLLGGHAVSLVGYDEIKKQFLVRNSWGSKWGDCGYCYFPYEYILNKELCMDFWIIKKISA